MLRVTKLFEFKSTLKKIGDSVQLALLWTTNSNLKKKKKECICRDLVGSNLRYCSGNFLVVFLKFNKCIMAWARKKLFPNDSKHGCQYKQFSISATRILYKWHSKVANWDTTTVNKDWTKRVSNWNKHTVVAYVRYLY